MKFDWKSALSSLAPMIGASIGGPFGGMAATAALELIGIEPEKGNEEAQLEQAMKGMTPEQAIQLKNAEKQWIATMRELDIKEEDLAVQNTKDARLMAREVGVWPQVVLSALFVAGYFTVLTYLATGKIHIDATMKDVFILLLGLLVRELPTIMQFWFGSSAGSKKKSDDLSNIVKS